MVSAQIGTITVTMLTWGSNPYPAVSFGLLGLLLFLALTFGPVESPKWISRSRILTQRTLEPKLDSNALKLSIPLVFQPPNYRNSRHVSSDLRAVTNDAKCQKYHLCLTEKLQIEKETTSSGQKEMESK